ncbi:MAG: PP2C family serine/threonine-protein phosphatase [Lachnospiraceae bacterium]
MNTTYDFAFSEQGYNHIKADKVCQDSSGHYSDDLMAVVVVADGHGSDNYPRTDRGSSFAVEATITAIREFVKTVEDSVIDISEDSDSYLEQLAKNILANWYAAVDADLEKYPFSEEELSKVSDKYKKRYMSGQRQEKAYGTTLIAVCQTRNYWFGMQIGDGKCVCISQDGSMYEPIPWDEDCQANITTSICDSEAIEEFRYCFMKECPVATLMGTDGIDDSYADAEEMYVLYRSILAIFAEHGRETGESEIQAFLPGLSRKGSGDDVSIAGIVSASLSTAFIEVLKAQCEYSNAKAHREQAEREVILAAEKQEYVLSAMKKAKMNYDLCVQKATEAQEAIEVAQYTQEDAIKRFEAAEIALSTAVTVYRNSITSENNDKAVVETAPDVTEDASSETATVEQDEVNLSTPVCEESVADQPTHVETDDNR